MKRNKWISLALCLMLLLGAASCGSTASSAASPSVSQQSGAPSGSPPDAPGGFGRGSSSADIDYTASAEITQAGTYSGETYVSTTADESALLISGADVTVENASVTKSGDSDGGDNCNFYGLNAAVLVKDGANVTITGGSVTSDASGANGVFC